jgi:hypothetical protein
MINILKKFIKKSNNLFNKKEKLEKKIKKEKSIEKKKKLENELKELEKQIKKELLTDKTNKDVAQIILAIEGEIDLSGLVALDNNAMSYFMAKLRK